MTLGGGYGYAFITENTLYFLCQVFPFFSVKKLPTSG
jgi:hypothetical protein